MFRSLLETEQHKKAVLTQIRTAEKGYNKGIIQRRTFCMVNQIYRTDICNRSFEFSWIIIEKCHLHQSVTRKRKVCVKALDKGFLLSGAFSFFLVTCIFTSSTPPFQGHHLPHFLAMTRNENSYVSHWGIVQSQICPKCKYVSDSEKMA